MKAAMAVAAVAALWGCRPGPGDLPAQKPEPEPVYLATVKIDDV